MKRLRKSSWAILIVAGAMAVALLVGGLPEELGSRYAEYKAGGPAAFGRGGQAWQGYEHGRGCYRPHGMRLAHGSCIGGMFWLPVLIGIGAGIVRLRADKKQTRNAVASETYSD